MVKVVIDNARGLVQSAGSGVAINTRVASATASVDAAGPSSPDVSGCNVLLVDTSGNNVTLGGLQGGVTGQVLQIVKTSASNNLVLENSDGDTGQDFLLKADTTITAQPGMFTCVFDGTNWIALITGVLS